MVIDMKKKVISLCFIAVLLSMTIISGLTVNAAKKTTKELTKDTSVETIKEVKSDGKISKADLTVVIDDCTISLGSNMKDYVSKIRKADDITQSKVCIGSGMEKIYTYGDIAISALEEKKTEKVYMIEISGEEKLPSGIGIGSSLEEVIKAYGADYENDYDLVTYIVDGNELNFYFADDLVDFIEIRTE